MTDVRFTQLLKIASGNLRCFKTRLDTANERMEAFFERVPRLDVPATPRSGGETLNLQPSPT